MRDRPDDEIEVTQDMLQAGLAAFVPNDVKPFEDVRAVLARVYRSMREVAPDQPKVGQS